MAKQTVVGWVVIALASAAVVPLAGVFASRNLSWFDGAAGWVLLSIICIGVLGGAVGGVALAVSRKNPLWLIATMVAMCAAYVSLLFGVGVGIGNMH